MSRTSAHPADDAARPDAPSSRRLALELLVASFVVLFQELALIRWLPSQVRVLAYFPNLILLAAFLGLGLGSLRAGKRSLLAWYPVALAALTAAALAASRVVFTESSGAEHLWLLYYDLPESAPVVDGVRLPILVAFVLGALSFVPLGQLIGERIEAFRRRSGALWGYSWDLAGSIAGVLAFTAAAMAGTFPALWLGVVFALMAPFFVRRRGLPALLFGVAAVGVVGSIALTEKNEVYSPYYALRAEAGGELHGVRVLTNGSLHQYGIGLRRAEPALSEEHALTREGYHLPYRLLDRPPRRALVLGAGTGNDVSVLLDEGAEHVDAVEIDPEILELGRRLHPDGPYASPSVTVHATDARSFLDRAEEPYDLIVFGTLDSMTRLSALSNVRLDDFVYTRECLEAARDLLTDDGGLVMYFMVSTDYILERLTALHLLAFDQYPFRIERHFGLFNTLLMSGPAFADYGAAPRAELAEEMRTTVLPELEVPADDWPFLYLRERSISGFYLGLMALLALLAVAGVAIASPEMRRSLAGGGFDAPMFLFGASFLLLETRSVTALNLLWGATWLTSAVVFGSILLMVLLATLLTAKLADPDGGKSPSSGEAGGPARGEARGGALHRWLRDGSSTFRWCLGGLAATLLVAFSVPVDALLAFDTTGRLVASLLVVGAPIFFASVCFALLFARRADAGRAFGWNLLGAVAGGLLEFTSMVLGFRALLLVALALYLLAAAAERRRAFAEVEA